MRVIVVEKRDLPIVTATVVAPAGGTRDPAGKAGTVFFADGVECEVFPVNPLTGATAAAVIPLSMAWIGDNVPYERRQPVLARFLIGQITGFSLGVWA